MSAVPVAALVTGGTSDLPSSVAFILSAKAGPAKATAAPNASVASMVLVMGLSLLSSASKQRVSNFIPEMAAVLRNFQRANDGEYRHTDADLKFSMTD